MKVYQLKSGRKIAFSDFPRPAEGDVVFFSPAEWSYIREQGFTDKHKDFLWDAKRDDHRYPIIPTDAPTLTQKQIAAKYCDEILSMLGRPKRENA